MAGHILCPTVLMRLDLMSMQLKAPWGTCLIRAVELKALVIKDGCFRFAPEKETR